MLPWLTVSAPTPPNTSTAVTVQGNNNLSLLPNGVYLGSVTVTATGAANYPASIPVVLTVSGSSVSGGSLTLGSLSPFYATQGGAAPNSQRPRGFHCSAAAVARSPHFVIRDL